MLQAVTFFADILLTFCLYFPPERTMNFLYLLNEWWNKLQCTLQLSVFSYNFFLNLFCHCTSYSDNNNLPLLYIVLSVVKNLFLPQSQQVGFNLKQISAQLQGKQNKETISLTIFVLFNRQFKCFVPKRS